MLNIVWLKRDLRLQDHVPFFEAEQSDAGYIPIYIFEPSALNYPDSSLRHQQFIFQSILEMNDSLREYQREVVVFHEEAIKVFSLLAKEYTIENVYSYQESGIRTTWERDKTVARFFKKNHIQWNEFQRDGVIRGIKNRDNWDKKWYAHVHKKMTRNQYSKADLPVITNPYPLSDSLRKDFLTYHESFQKPGERYAWKYLYSFCKDRGKNYSRHISKPMESRMSSGRISPYLAWGNLSIRQAYQFVKTHPNYAKNKGSFNGLLTRLKWHCHFIQKFEMECDYETRCVNRGYESMEYTNNERLIEAWQKGETGLPLVDACMRCLQETGWINFRMRAMLVSTFCHHFDCDWKKGVHYLARLFLDYEPGIHYTQFQMQAGTTGINTVRIYNPIKQSKDHDPIGTFIKKWVKELQDMPEGFIHEPWKMTELDKSLLHLSNSYNNPVADIAETGKKARAKIWGHRNDPLVKKESKRIVEVHTRNSKERKEELKID